jgi:hypothetical protein
MIEQAGGATGLGLVVDPAGHLAREGDGPVNQTALGVAPGLRDVRAVVEPGVQVG